MRSRYLYRPTLRPATCCSLPPGIEWGYAETPPYEAGRPGILPSRYDFGVIWTERALTRDECSRFGLVPHRANAYA